MGKKFAKKILNPLQIIIVFPYQVFNILKCVNNMKGITQNSL